MARLAVEEKEQCIHFDRVQQAVIMGRGKGQTCPTVGLGGEEPVPLLLVLERPMLHEEAIELRTHRVRSRVALNVENGRWRLVARNVRHNLTGPYKAHGEDVGQPRGERLDEW